jgi:hypothetical protein
VSHWALWWLAIYTLIGAFVAFVQLSGSTPQRALATVIVVTVLAVVPAIFGISELLHM